VRPSARNTRPWMTSGVPGSPSGAIRPTDPMTAGRVRCTRSRACTYSVSSADATAAMRIKRVLESLVRMTALLSRRAGHEKMNVDAAADRHVPRVSRGHPEVEPVQREVGLEHRGRWIEADRLRRDDQWPR